MIKLEYECEVLTPMVIGGAGEETTEIRVPSVKGMLRYWWRVMQAYSGITDINLLREKEGMLFGCIGEKGKALKSNVSVRSFLQEEPKIDQNVNFFRYARGKKSSNKAGLDKGTRFIIQFIINDLPYSTESNKNLSSIDIAKEVQNSFETLALLGGLGRRTRRGFGVFKINKKTQTIIRQGKKDKTILPCISIDDLLNKVRKKNEKRMYGLHVEKIITFNSAYENAEDMLEIIDKISHEQRVILSKQYRNRIDKALGSANKHQSSPLYISVFQHNNKYRLVLTVLAIEPDKTLQEIQNKFIKELRREYEQ